jgi:hypothetical protein
MTAAIEQVKVALALPKGPEELWENACAYGALGFTVGDLARCRYGLAYRTAEQWVSALKRQGKIKIVGARQAHGRRQPLYAVVRANNMAPVVRRAAYEAASQHQQNMWNAMRRMSHFALQELCFAASTEGVTIHPKTASKYVSALTLADLIEVVEPARAAKGHVGKIAGLWRLKRSAAALGPKAPQIFQAKFVFDPNNGRVIGQAEVLS